MKLYRKFPIQDVVDVPVEGVGTLKVRFKYPSLAQAMKLTNNMAICRYCIAELPDIQDENGEPITFTLKRVKDEGEELPEDILTILFNNGLVASIGKFYEQNIYVKDEQKKK